MIHADQNILARKINQQQINKMIEKGQLTSSLISRIFIFSENGIRDIGFRMIIISQQFIILSLKAHQVKSTNIYITSQLNSNQIPMPPKKDQKAVEQPPKQLEPQAKPHELVGYSKFQYLNGVIYEGAWKIINKQKVKHGYGKLTLPTSHNTPPESYEGDWYEDKMQGYGTYNYPDGSIYRGEWSDNKHNGRGVFEFANGTKYQGNWRNHLMEGMGEYTDHLNRKWRGEFRNGVFDSRSQRQLVKQISVQERKQAIKEEIKTAIEELIQIIQTDKSQSNRIKAFFERNASINKLIKNTQPKYDVYAPQKWIEYLKSLNSDKFVVLTHRKESKIIEQSALLAEQLQGLGQVVQSYGEQGFSVAWMQISPGHWIVTGMSQIK